MKADLVSLGPAVVSSRMVRDYVTELYEPTAASADALRADGFARAGRSPRGRQRSAPAGTRSPCSR
jgi:glycogen phosphorylase